ncbi:MAG: hypothetical protein R2911_17880 [Caldilineaceae bacterium]
MIDKDHQLAGRQQRHLGLASPLDGIELAGLTVWQACGIVRQGGSIVAPQWPAAWNWWALPNVPKLTGPKSDETFSLVWDGTVLHATEPVSELPVQLHKSIRTRGSDEIDFNLHFEFVDEPTGGQSVNDARPAQTEIKSVFRSGCFCEIGSLSSPLTHFACLSLLPLVGGGARGRRGSCGNHLCQNHRCLGRKPAGAPRLKIDTRGAGGYGRCAQWPH